MSEASSPGLSSEHNLLYVQLALQLDLVTRETLLQALEALAFARDRSVAELLQEQGSLTPEQRRTLDRAVREYLETQDDDAASRLAAEDLPPTVADVLQLPVVTDPGAHLFAVGSGPGPERMRYRVLRLHARGGLGMVSVARDAELGREVALKELEANGAENEVSRRRFVREAEITGSLEHPGIVPVYGLGRYADGRPYYVMRLIRGETLQQAVEKLHAGKPGYTLRDLLTRFVAVCNTIAYAHSRSVIHRDLKPQNVMLGPYGETLVVDWGLAKVIDQSVDAKGSREQALQISGGEAGDHAATREGATLGTPAYMSPEQATGRLEEQSTATDVYGLGATLYAVLTGQTPVGDCDAEEALERVQQGDWPSPRQVNPAVSRALDAICHKALALKPADRYPSVLALAADIERWLAGEAVGAYREPATVRVRRWLRRHKTAVVTIAVLVGTVVSGLGAVQLAVQSERDRGKVLERQREAVLHILEADNQEREGQYELAVHSYRDALTLLEQLTAEHPAPENQNLYASTLRDFGTLLHAHHDDGTARPLLQQAVGLSREVQKATPEVPRYRETFLDNLTRLSQLLLDLGDHAAASEIALTAVGTGIEPSDGTFQAARIFSRCVPIAAKDTTLPESSRSERVRYYSGRALELLRRSIRYGFRDAIRVNKDSAFDPLRNLPEFRKAVSELQAAARDTSASPDSGR